MSVIGKNMMMAVPSSDALPDPYTKLYIAGPNEIYNVDISDPDNISISSTTSSSSVFSLGINESANELFAGTSSNYLYSYSISGDSLSLIQSKYDTYGADRGTTIQMDIDRDLLFLTVADEDVLASWSIADSSNMILTGYLGTRFEPENIYAYVNSSFLDTSAQIIYTIDSNNGYFAATDVSSAYSFNDMVILDSVFGNLYKGHMDVDLSESVAYSMGYSTSSLYSSKSLNSIDISNPSGLSIISSFTGVEFSGKNYSDFVIDDIEKVGYISINSNSDFSSASGIVSVDISDPSAMSVLDFFEDALLERAYRLAIDKGSKTLYVSTTASPYRILSIDISDPSNLSIKSVLDTGINGVCQDLLLAFQ